MPARGTWSNPRDSGWCIDIGQRLARRRCSSTRSCSVSTPSASATCTATITSTWARTAWPGSTTPTARRRSRSTARATPRAGRGLRPRGRDASGDRSMTSVASTPRPVEIGPFRSPPAHEPPGRDLRHAGQHDGLAAGLLRRHRATPTRSSGWPAAPTCCCARRRSSTAGQPAQPPPDRPAGAEYAARAGAGQLVLTHLVPWNDQDRTLGEASAIYGGPLSAGVGRASPRACERPVDRRPSCLDPTGAPSPNSAR